MDGQKGKSGSKAAKSQNPGGGGRTAAPPRTEAPAGQARSRLPPAFGHVRFHDVNVDPPPTAPPMTVFIDYASAPGGPWAPLGFCDVTLGYPPGSNVLQCGGTLQDDGQQAPNNALCLQVTLNGLPRCGGAPWPLVVIDVNTVPLPPGVTATRINGADFTLVEDPTAAMPYTVHYWVEFDDSNQHRHLLVSSQQR